MAMIGWLALFVVLIGVEAGTMALTTIWFAGGALAAFFAAMAGLTIHAQLVIFLAVSFVLLIFTRPFAIRFVNKGTVKTNVGEIIGKKARVTSPIDNSLSQGAAVVNGQEWTARAAEDEVTFSVGETVRIKEIRGVKLIVEAVKEEK